MITQLPRIDDAMIKQSVAFYAQQLCLTSPKLNHIAGTSFNGNDPELKTGLDYDISNDDEYIYIQYKNKVAKHSLKGDELLMPLDNFTQTILCPMITQLRDSFYEYDDAGQLI